jgi:hypothetical protein
MTNFSSLKAKSSGFAPTLPLITLATMMPVKNVNCPLRKQLEQLHHCHAELEEHVQVKEMQCDAIESGLAECHSQDVEECPLCCEHKTCVFAFERYSCCGGWCCLACTKLMASKRKQALAAMGRDSSVAELTELAISFGILSLYPFHRAFIPDTMEDRRRLMKEKAEAGKAWAQAFLGHDLNAGNGVPKDTQAELQWFALAADQSAI